jgi:hypothetical protein
MSRDSFAPVILPYNNEQVSLFQNHDFFIFFGNVLELLDQTHSPQKPNVYYQGGNGPARLFRL